MTVAFYLRRPWSADLYSPSAVGGREIYAAIVLLATVHQMLLPATDLTLSRRHLLSNMSVSPAVMS